MFNRTAEYIAHGARSLGPLAKLQPEQRRRVEKSSEKIGKVLGEMPVVDIISSSPRAVDGITSEVGELKQGKKGGKWKKKAFSPPILRLKLTPLRRKSTRFGPRTPRTPRTPRADARASRRSLKPVPEYDLAEPESHVDTVPRPAVRMSQTSIQQEALFLSPLPPVSPFSPMATAVSLEQQYQRLRQLACGFPGIVVEKLPSVPEAVEAAKNVSSYLDLYRVANQSVRDVDATSTVSDLDTAYTAYTDATNPDDAYTAYIACTPVSARHRRRRSSSFSHVPRPSALSSGTASPVPRSSFVVPHSASVYSFNDQPGRYTLVIKIPSPLTPSALIPFPMSTANSNLTSRTRTFVLDTPKRARRDTLKTPGDDSCPLQEQQREARVRAVLEAMGESVGPAFTPPAPQTPARGPYWVRQSYRISAQGSVRRRKSSARVPPTPRTVRRERRQGWGGEWRAGKMGTAVDGLREIRTPAPRVPPKDAEDEVPPVPTKDFVIIQ